MTKKKKKKPANSPDQLKRKIPSFKPAVAGLIASLALLFLVLSSLPQEEKEISFASPAPAFQVSAGVTVEQQAGFIRLTKTAANGAPIFFLVPNVNVDADLYDVIALELKSDQAFEPGRLLFVSRYNRGFQYNFGMDFDSGLRGRFGRRLIYMRAHGAWQWIVKDILVNFGPQAKQVEIKSVKFIRANPGTLIRAGWSGLLRYGDPKLGSCFAMASPLFIWNSFNIVLTPYLLALLALAALGLLAVNTFKLNRRYGVLIVAGFFLAFYFCWTVLETRNGIFYLKGAARDVGLYWGKDKLAKREIVVGDKKFADFMEYCNKNIPDDAKLFNLVSREPPGTPPNYLWGVMSGFLQRPRATSSFHLKDEVSPPYYIVYYTDPGKIAGLENERSAFDNYVDGYLELAPGQNLTQEYFLWNRIEDITALKLTVRGEGRLSVTVLGADGKIEVGRGTLASLGSNEADFRITGLPGYLKNRVFLKVENSGKTTVKVGITREDTYLPGKLFLNGREHKGDLSFDLFYSIKSPKLFKAFGEGAYIFTR
ncbi:MAG: hypothetical protein JW873_00720 [Candidatus Saganbacteria bacterium]|nr:hypothetical protein [Candidatus Saganbacteria bacterium]